MSKKLNRLMAFLILAVIATNANAVYLNINNITVQEGPGSTYTTSQNTFNNGQTINKVIDAPSADATEFHNQTTHLWFSGGALELEFDFQQQYDLTTLHFWNYTGEGFDVDQIDFVFFDSTNTTVGSLTISPSLGSSPGILAQDIVLAAPLDVQYVTALLTGTNGQVDFQNMGFTATLSTDRCVANPNDPVCTNDDPTTVPLPGTISLFILGLAGLGYNRKMKA